MEFFDDDGPASTTGSGRTRERRPRRSPRRNQILRIAILAAALFVLIFALAWWAKTCQQNQKNSSYRTYFEGVTSAINDSNALGKQLQQLVDNPTKFSRKQLQAKLADFSGRQAEIAVRADRLTPPDTLTNEKQTFATGMKVRSQGFDLLQAAMLAALGNKVVGANRIVALDGYFSGPDAYYMGLAYLQSRQVMSKQGVSGADVPTSTFYLTSHIFDPAKIDSMLSRIGKSTKLTGVRGVSLGSVTAQPGNITLLRGKTVNVPASAQLAFVVKVTNQGDVRERNVPVTATIKPPSGADIVQRTVIADLPKGQTGTATLTGFAVPSTALTHVSTLTIKVGPVPQERVLSNNSGQYKILLQLK